ncbi:MAG: hypothetical protein ABI467_28310 [Kofleriaceae bacterium]
MWDFLGRLFARRATLLPPLPPLPRSTRSLPAPVASIGRNASPAALLHLMELFPDQHTIGVLDERRELVGVIEVARARSQLQELEDTRAVIVADFI